MTTSDTAEPIGWAGGRPSGDPLKDWAGVLSLATVCAITPTCALSIAGVRDAETAGFIVGLVAAIAMALHWRKQGKRVCPVRLEGASVVALEKDGRVRWVEPVAQYTELWLSAQRRIGTRFTYSLQLVHPNAERAVHFRAVIDGDETKALEGARAMAAQLGGVPLRDHRGVVHPR
ncbi:MAG: hypothetical protein JNK05_07365 [Myxococcales bacterium]|nr:hypothetical protein [Myxococcales bacterium]